MFWAAPHGNFGYPASVWEPLDGSGHEVAQRARRSRPDASDRERRRQPDAHPRTSSSSTTRSQLGELLVGAQLITHAQLAEALLQQSPRGSGSGTLVELGALTERDLARELSAQLLVPLVDLSQQAPSPEAIDVLPESVARAHMAIPIVVDENGVTIAVADPTPELANTLANAWADRPVGHRPHVGRPERHRLGLSGPRQHPGAHPGVRGAAESPQRLTDVAAQTHRRATPPSSRWSTCSSPRRCATARRTSTSSRRASNCGSGSASTAPSTTPSSCPSSMAPGPREPAQDHGRDEHRRAAPAPGRPVHHGGRRSRHRRPGVDGGDHLGRDLRAAGPRQEPVALPAGRARHARGHPRGLRRHHPGPLRHGACAPARPGAARRPPCTRRSTRSTSPTATS